MRHSEIVAGEGKPIDNIPGKSRVSQVVSLTGFSFVGGPAMNDSQAAVGILSRAERAVSFNGLARCSNDRTSGNRTNSA